LLFDIKRFPLAPKFRHFDWKASDYDGVGEFTLTGYPSN
jgi:hypothetical protein